MGYVVLVCVYVCEGLLVCCGGIVGLVVKVFENVLDFFDLMLLEV